MRTRPKALLAVSVALIVLFSALSWVLSVWLQKNYLDLEHEVALEDMMRLKDSFKAREEDLYTKLGDWSQWDDTYQFIQDENQAYIDSNLQDSTLELLKLHIITIINHDGRVIFEKGRKDGVSFGLPSSLYDQLRSSAVGSGSTEGGFRGLLALPDASLLFAIRPVVRSDGSGVASGWILFGRYIAGPEADIFSNLMHFPVTLQRVDESLRHDASLERVLENTGPEGIVVPEAQKDSPHLYGYLSIPDSVTGEPAILLRTELDREIYAQGQKSTAIFLRMMALAGVFIGGVVIGLFEVIVLRRLFRLEQGVIGVRQGKKHQLVPISSRDDEFGSLAQEINRSLTALYKSEEEVEEQRDELKKFQLAAEKSFNHLVITDASGVVLYANPAASENTGYSNEEILGSKPSLWGKQMSPKVYTDLWRTIKEEKKTFFGEFKNRRKNGQFYLASASITPILDDQGEVKYFVGIERDITEERARQKRDRENMKQLEMVNDRLASEKSRAEGILRYLRSIGEAVYATDKRGTIVFINDAAAKLIRQDQTVILGQEARSVFQFRQGVTEDAPEILPTELALQAGHPQSFQSGVFFTCQHQPALPIRGSFAPIFEKDHMAGVIVVFQDMTDQYRLEKMKESFLSISAHQLRTPLGSMRWSMELLMNGDLGKLPKKAETVVGQLHENSTRMITIVKDLLNVSKIDQGETQEDFQERDVAELVKEVVTTMSGAAKKKGLKLSFVAPGKNIPLLKITPKHLYEAIENLIANAIRYNRSKGEIAVEVYVENNQLVISVADTGIGIPESDQDKIFSKFYRASNAVRYYTDGSGLGLAVVKSYVEENGGQVTFKSKEGVGTTFFVRLPINSSKK